MQTENAGMIILSCLTKSTSRYPKIAAVQISGAVDKDRTPIRFAKLLLG